ncbi:MAG: hypothetical protein WBD07_15505 [Vicinamibacterales bacterium]
MRMRRAKMWDLAGTMVLLFAGSAHAQSTPCTAPPQAPASVAPSLVPAIPAATPGAPPSTPTVLTLTWAASLDTAPTRNTPTAYVIEAGSAPGASNVAVVETERTELTYSTPMANGIVYARVRAKNTCGISSASPEVMARITDSVASGKPNPLVLLDSVRVLRERLGGTTFVRVAGQVRNGWRASVASFIEVTATFEGPAGEVLGTKSTYVNGRTRRLKTSRIVTDTALEPTATGCFLVFADFPDPRVSSVGLVVTSSDGFETEALKGRVRVEGTPLQQADAFGDLMVSGQMKNIGDRLTYFNEIWVETKDTEGKVSDCDATSVNGSRVVLDDAVVTQTGLNPAQVGAFGSFTEAVSASTGGLRHWINWEEREERRSASPTPLYRELKERLAAVSGAEELASSPRERAELRDALRREIRSLERR